MVARFQAGHHSIPLIVDGAIDAEGHGSDDGDPLEAALANRASAVLILLAPERAHSRDAATVWQLLANPTGTTKRAKWRRLEASLLAAHRELRRRPNLAVVLRKPSTTVTD